MTGFQPDFIRYIPSVIFVGFEGFSNTDDLHTAIFISQPLRDPRSRTKLENFLPILIRTCLEECLSHFHSCHLGILLVVQFWQIFWSDIFYAQIAVDNAPVLRVLRLIPEYRFLGIAEFYALTGIVILVLMSEKLEERNPSAKLHATL